MIHPACNLCRGACCEILLLKISGGGDNQRWLDMHGKATPMGTLLRCRCQNLTKDGLCGIYTDRPEVCAVFQPGAAECRFAVSELRPSQQVEIYRLLDVAEGHDHHEQPNDSPGH